MVAPLMATPQKGHTNSQDEQPCCAVIPIPGIGERRTYRGIVQPFATHAHDHYVIGRVREGRRQLICNDETFELLSGDLVVFNPGDTHSCAQSDEGWFAYDSITADGPLFDDARLKGPKIEDDEAVATLEGILAAIDSAGFSGRTDLLEQIGALFDLLETEEPPAHVYTKHDEAATRVYARFCGNLAETPRLEDLAAAEGISPYALIRAYRKRFSITPLQHLTSLRIECATKLLAAGVEPSCVATETGFADQAHLTRAFKQRVGTTPAAYRKMMMRTSERA